MHTGETPCRSYRFGHVEVDVFPEVVTIAVPYGAEHESFIAASTFVERYTHAAEATLLEDDELAVELHVYPNTENLLGRERPCPLPSLDPRLGQGDRPRRRPADAGVVLVTERPPVFCALARRLGSVDWYLQDVAVRSTAALANLAPLAY